MERHIATDRRLVLHARRPDGTLESQRLDPPSLGTIVNRVDDGFWQKAKENAHVRRLLDAGHLRDTDEAQAIVDGEKATPTPEKPKAPLQAAAVKVGKERLAAKTSSAFPVPKRGPQSS